MNWYFIAASVVVLLPAVYWVTMRFVIPRLGTYDDTNADINADDNNDSLTKEENRAVFWANISFFIVILVIILCAIPEHSFLRNAKTGSLLNDAPIINGVGLLILILFLVPGLVYGVMMNDPIDAIESANILPKSFVLLNTFIITP